MTVIHRVESPERLASAAADFILGIANERLRSAGSFSVALAGGTTPKPTYARLAEMLPTTSVDPAAVNIFWGDERCVPLDDPMSNYRMAHDVWLGGSAIPPDHIHPMRCDEDPEGGARAYEKLLRSHYADQEWPAFDLVLLGLGPDGHCASLFPGSRLIEEGERWVAAEIVEKVGGWRLTLTPPAINAAGAVAFLVAGEKKAEAVHQVIVGEHDPQSWPAQIVEPEEGQLHWFLDEAAASLL